MTSGRRPRGFRGTSDDFCLDPDAGSTGMSSVRRLLELCAPLHACQTSVKPTKEISELGGTQRPLR